MDYKSINLFDFKNTISSELFAGHMVPWEILPVISDFILEVGKKLDKNRFEEVEKNIWIAKSASVAKTAFLSAPLIVDEEAQIRHCAFIRGSAIIGKKAVVGNSTEIKNSILFDGAQVPHYNYIGDSILGYKVHFGAGAITSNLKSDKTLITVRYFGKKIETRLKKFGAIVGDECEIGCNTVLNPGTVIGKNTTVYPLSMVRGFVDEDTIYKRNNDIIRKD